MQFKSNVDGKEFLASIIPVKKKFDISGPNGMRSLDMNFESFVEIAVYRKTDSSFRFVRMLFPPDYLIEINTRLYPFSDDEWPVFCEEILKEENILYTDRGSEEIKAANGKWEVIRVTDKKLFMPFFKKVPISFYMRRKKTDLN